MLARTAARAAAPGLRVDATVLLIGALTIAAFVLYGGEPFTLPTTPTSR